MDVGDVLRHKAKVAEERAFAAKMLAAECFFDDFDMDGECADGCIVEPDGACEHGYSSWLLVAGLI